MADRAGRSKNALFIYTQDDSGRFWVYDGRVYHHFFCRMEDAWYIRSQAYLPEHVVGHSVTMSSLQRKTLEALASGFHVTLTFFDSEEECQMYASMLSHEQLIFDRAWPAGFFSIDSDLKRKRRNEAEEE